MTYVLLIFLKSGVEKIIGKIGKVKFLRGYYAYVGSARLNFEHRIRRHLKREKTLFWHIDYLLSDERAKVEKIFYTNQAIEHEVAMSLYKSGFKVVKNFGSSDCNCPGHLFYVEDVKRFERLIMGMGLNKWKDVQNIMRTN